ncbi:glycosyltransferase [Lusitaniella coriacea]|uniref:glycosyltransferase n=1 Tax=Lusitaniella coriacea TaxID=1983105 RepID=UPI003CF7F297
MSKTILIYRDELLPYSETFIPAQVEQYSRYTGFYAGTSRHRKANYPLPKERTLVLSDIAKLSEKRKIFFLTTGYGYPQWFEQLLQLSPSLIHAHFGLSGVWALPIAKDLQIPLVVTFHGYDITLNLWSANRSDIYGPKPLPQVYLWRRKRLFKEASCCIAVSEFIRSQLIAKGCSPEKIEVHYIGVDVERFRPDLTVPRQPVVLFVGRLANKKGCQYLIQAMAAVQSAMPELELVIIGDGKLRADLEAQAKASLQRYRFLGVQSSDAVREWMNRALMLCVPSVTDATGNSEGLPITVLEAQAMQLPVVGSIHAGIPEAIEEGETGLLVEERNGQQLAEKILTFARDEGLREKCAIAARQQVEQKFNLKQNTTQLEALYDRLLS